MASKKAKEGKKDEGKRAQRTTSNVFAMFSQNQIQEFKEAFTMIDQNRDGFIDVEDLKSMYQSLGRDPDKSQLEDMLKEAPGPLNFTMFLTLFGEKTHGTDPEQTLLQAFQMFDKEGKGQLAEDYVKDLLMNMGDNFNQNEVKQTWKEAPIEGGMLDYGKFVQIIKRGKEECD